MPLILANRSAGIGTPSRLTRSAAQREPGLRKRLHVFANAEGIASGNRL